jgi:enoyl-CoA hydratase/carnithine racemase
MAKDKVVLFEKKGPIAYITLNRPEKINAMNGEMYDLLAEVVKEYTADDDLRCAIISGAGGNFSSGGDLKFFQETRRVAGRYELYDFPAYKALDHCPKPVIAAVDGYCLASGFNCAVFKCDIRIASERAVFGMPAVKRALPGGDSYPMPFTWHMTLGNALYMILTGKMLSAEEALRMGIVSEVVPHENLMDRATELATIVCECSTVHIRAQKQFLYRLMESPGSFCLRLQEMILGPLSDTEDSIEGKKAFIEKRRPLYKNS